MQGGGFKYKVTEIPFKTDIMHGTSVNVLTTDKLHKTLHFVMQRSGTVGVWEQMGEAHSNVVPLDDYPFDTIAEYNDSYQSTATLPTEPDASLGLEGLQDRVMDDDLTKYLTNISKVLEEISDDEDTSEMKRLLQSAQVSANVNQIKQPLKDINESFEAYRTANRIYLATAGINVPNKLTRAVTDAQKRIVYALKRYMDNAYNADLQTLYTEVVSLSTAVNAYVTAVKDATDTAAGDAEMSETNL